MFYFLLQRHLFFVGDHQLIVEGLQLFLNIDFALSEAFYFVISFNFLL